MNTCSKTGSDGARAIAERRVVGRHVTPAEQPLTLLGDDALEERLDQLALGRVVRQEDQAGAVMRRRAAARSRAACDAEEHVRHLDQDAGAVAGVGLAAAGAAVLEIDEQLEALARRSRATLALQVDDEADAAGVLLVLRVVQALGVREIAALTEPREEEQKKNDAYCSRVSSSPTATLSRQNWLSGRRASRVRM